MALVVDLAFISECHPKYDTIERDEPEYKRLVELVKKETHQTGTISKNTFVAIVKWKKAHRRSDLMELERHESLYPESLRRCLVEPDDRKLAALLSRNVKLPGVGAPLGSTLVHFLHPDTLPIMDVRTVEVLHKAQLICSKQRELMHYSFTACDVPFDKINLVL